MAGIYLEDNMEIIRSIFAFYNLDMAVHNSYPVENPEEQQVDGRRRKLVLTLQMTLDFKQERWKEMK